MITQIYKDIKRQQQKRIMKNKIKKGIKISTLAAIGLGLTSIGGMAIYKNSKNKNEEGDFNEEENDGIINTYKDECYCACKEDIINEDECKCRPEKDETLDVELKSKVDEFNSNRLSYINEHKNLKKE